MGNVGKQVTTYQEYLERCIRAADRGITLCEYDTQKAARHKASKKAYEDALRAFQKYFIS